MFGSSVVIVYISPSHASMDCALMCNAVDDWYQDRFTTAQKRATILVSTTTQLLGECDHTARACACLGMFDAAVDAIDDARKCDNPRLAHIQRATRVTNLLGQIGILKDCAGSLPVKVIAESARRVDAVGDTIAGCGCMLDETWPAACQTLAEKKPRITEK